jgi:biotin carboxylase
VAPTPNSVSWKSPIVRLSSPPPSVSVPVSSVMTPTGLRRSNFSRSDGGAVGVGPVTAAINSSSSSIPAETLSHRSRTGNRHMHQLLRATLDTGRLDAPAPGREDRHMPETLRGISDIRAFFRTNQTPVYFISPTAFNLLGIDRWLRNFFYVNYFDSFEGTHPRVFVPKELPYREFESMEDICNYLLGHKEVLDRIAARGGGGKCVFVMFDDETEQAAAAAGLEVAHPSAELRHRLDSKIVTTQLGNEAGVPSAPNTLGWARTYAELTALAKTAGLGDDLVVQTPYGDSGKTTFFIQSERDWDRYAGDIVDQELKVMRRINCRAAAVEAVITRHGTVVGPLMTDLTGYPELTPHKGGWCGNDIFPEALSPEHRERARVLTQKLGDRLAGEGYRGFVEIDYLADVDTGELYLGEINPRISGVTSMTNVTAGAYADVPLFLFHMLEFLDVDYEIDVDDINQRWAQASSIDVWSQIILKDIGDEVEELTATPKTGIWRMDEQGGVEFARWGHDWHSLHDDAEAFYLRVLAPGDYRYPGADLGVLVARSRMQTEDNELTPRAHQWIDAIHGQFAGVRQLAEPEHPVPAGAMAFKTA